MEIFELKYFLAVAQTENVSKASGKLHISAGSLSKAIARLESELSVTLFSREGRNIRLTDHGRLFQRRAAEIVRLEEATRIELAGHEGTLQVVIAGPEILLSEAGVSVTDELKQRFPKSSFEYHAVSDHEAVGMVSRGEAHLALITDEPPGHSELTSKKWAEAHFQTVAGKGHPLFSAAKAKKTIPVDQMLQHGFASPSHPLLGKVGMKQSLDGWRDDKFPRRIEFLASSLKVLEELVVRGHALGYLPDYCVKRMDVEVLKLSGCPYSCNQTIRLVTKNPQDFGWLNQWF